MPLDRGRGAFEAAPFTFAVAECLIFLDREDDVAIVVRRQLECALIVTDGARLVAREDEEPRSAIMDVRVIRRELERSAEGARGLRLVRQRERRAQRQMRIGEVRSEFHGGRGRLERLCCRILPIRQAPPRNLHEHVGETCEGERELWIAGNRLAEQVGRRAAFHLQLLPGEMPRPHCEVVRRRIGARRMTALDVFVFLLLIGGGAVGFVRGFVHEVISILAWIVGIAMLKLFHTQLWTGLENSFHTSPAGGAVLAFALLFVPSFLLVKLLARTIGGKTRRHSVLGPFDRTLGAGFGLLKGLLGATLFFLLANLATDMVYGPQADRPHWMTSSRTFPLLNASGRAIVDWYQTRSGKPKVEDE